MNRFSHQATRVARLLTLSTIVLSVASRSVLAAPTVPAGGDVVAQGGAIALTSADVQALLASLPSSEQAAVATDLAALDRVLRAEVVRRAILADAKSSGFDRQAATLAALERLRDEGLFRLWIAQQSTAPATYPSDDEVRTAYEANKSALSAPSEYHVAQLFIATPDGMEPLKLGAALRKSADLTAKVGKSDFAQLARENSEQADSAAQGGDLGYLAENRLLPEIASAVHSMKPGDVAGPIKTAQGLHFIKLLDRRPGATPTLAEAHDGLVRALRGRRASELQQAYLNTLNQKLGISVNQIELAQLQRGIKTAR